MGLVDGRVSGRGRSGGGGGPGRGALRSCFSVVPVFFWSGAGWRKSARFAGRAGVENLPPVLGGCFAVILEAGLV